jgi:hypothetical protein
VEPLTLYFDRCAGRRFPEAMAVLGLKGITNIYHQHTPRHSLGLGGTRKTPLFSPAEPDDKWLEFVGTRGWIVFSQDRKFHAIENEIYALKQFNVGCFYLWGASATPAEKAFVFLKAHKKIIEAIRTTPKPFLYSITKNGNLKRIDIDGESTKQKKQAA